MAAPLPRGRRRGTGARGLAPWFAAAFAASAALLAAQGWGHRAAFVRAKLEWPLKRPLSQKEQENIRKGSSTGGLPVKLPNDNVGLGPVGMNLAVEDLDRLASEPLRLRIDRTGKTILEGEAVEAAVPWSKQDNYGRSSAAAPLSWEEFEARYKKMDNMLVDSFGQFALADISKVLTSEAGKDEYRTVRTFSWRPEGGSSASAVLLVGVTETSARSRQLAARAVYEAEPSALLVQLCRERIGRKLVMPAEHRFAAANYARGYAACNPHRLRPEVYMADALNGDYEALKMWVSDLAFSTAVDEFERLPRRGAMPKLLCLGDVRASKLERLRKQRGNESLQAVPTMSARGKQLVRGLLAMAGQGHEVVLGVMHTELLATAATWLERAGASFVGAADTSDLEAGRESIAADVAQALAAPARVRRRGPAAAAVLGFGQRRLGDFLNERGLELLRRRKERLAKLTRLRDLVQHVEAPKVWAVAELLGSEGPTPGPGALLAPAAGLRFEFGHLEIPEHYLRDAGMEAHAPALWQSLRSSGAALDTRHPAELEQWLAGALEERVGQAGASGDRGNAQDEAWAAAEDDEAWALADDAAWAAADEDWAATHDEAWAAAQDWAPER